MKYFYDSNNKLHAYAADGSQDEFILPGLRPLTAAELSALNDPATVARARKKDEIRSAFEADSNANVTALGIVWQGGYEKALRLDAAKRFAQLAGQPNVTFYDLANVGHTLSFPEADQVIMAIAGAYQASFTRKQSKMVAIDQAANVSVVQTITY